MPYNFEKQLPGYHYQILLAAHVADAEEKTQLINMTM